jgi:hypothetical protein
MVLILTSPSNRQKLARLALLLLTEFYFKNLIPKEYAMIKEKSGLFSVERKNYLMWHGKGRLCKERLLRPERINTLIFNKKF